MITPHAPEYIHIKVLSNPMLLKLKNLLNRKAITYRLTHVHFN